MITVENYSERSAKIDFTNMAPELKAGHEFMQEYGDLYNDDADIKEAIDLYIRELNAGHLKHKFEQAGAKETNEPKNCQVLAADGTPDISPEAVASLEACIATLPQTKDKHFKDGKYTKDRIKLHKSIIAKFKKNKPCVSNREPIAVLTGGAPGSGKSTWLKKYADFMSSDRVYHIDADEVRAMLPEYKGWNATATHIETKEIVNKLIDEIGVPCEHDLIYDGTMNRADNYKPLIDKLKGLGYKTFIIYISVPKSVSEQRVLDRYKKRGRYVPKFVIDELYEKGLDAYEQLLKQVDGFIRIDGISGEIIEQGGMKMPTTERYEKKPCPDDCEDCEPCKEKKAVKMTSDEPKPQIKTKLTDGDDFHAKSIKPILINTEENAKKAATGSKFTNAQRQQASQIIKQIVEEETAGKTELTQEQVLSIAKRINENRSLYSQINDAAKDSRVQRLPTEANLRTWAKNPGGSDILGVDSAAATKPTLRRDLDVLKMLGL